MKGAFKVYGVSYQQCLEKAKKALLRSINLTDYTLDEFEEMAHTDAQELYQKDQLKAVSHEFSAPQFAQEFIKLADKDKFRLLRIYAYQEIDGKFKWKEWKQ
jgi:hypothetical protein